jgi:hypothetical protein
MEPLANTIVHTMAGTRMISSIPSLPEYLTVEPYPRM